MKSQKPDHNIRKIEVDFSISKNILLILFAISISGIAIGLSGWVLNPGFMWKFPESYFMIMTFTGIVLLSLTFTARIFTSNLKEVLVQYRNIE